jgi:predicted polyphosphate/ATP-dependent NAD kinase
MSARTPFEPTYLQSAKALISGADEEAIKDEIAEQLREDIEAMPGTLFLLGPGSTVQAVGRALQIDKTLLGIDAVGDGKVVGKDLAGRQILVPIASSFSVQLRRRVSCLAGGISRSVPQSSHRRPQYSRAIDPAKLARTPLLRFDTGRRDA